MKPELHGTYWLVKYRGDTWITQGDKPEKKGDNWRRNGRGMGWLCVNKNLSLTSLNHTTISKSDFDGIDFPEITEEESPLEIEISKSGRVYTY